MKIRTAIKKGSKILENSNISSFKLDSELLMSRVLNKKRDYIILNDKEKLSNNALKNYQNLIKERQKGKPIAYITGKKEFWKFEFDINQNVLIPRPDTELIVEEILKLTKNKSQLKVLDIGTGSGCIILSILKERKGFYGVGIDKSKKCVEMSRVNSNKLNVTKRIKFFKSDVDNFSYGKYDLVISNPPYINKSDFNCLEKDVANFEPKIALDGGIDGLSEIKKIVNKSSELLKINGKLVLEIAYDQKEKVKRILNDNRFYINKILKDYSKNDRCIVSTKM